MNLEFQMYHFEEDHEYKDNDEEDCEDSIEDSDSPKNTKVANYIIHTFGRTYEGKSVYLKFLE